jgi:hypothetical protein
MANTSIANGAFIFVDMTPRLINEFLHFTNTYLDNDNIDYRTSIDRYFKENINNVFTDNDKIEEEVVVHFTGTGRWHYDFNLKMFGGWIADGLKEDSIPNEERIRWFKFLNDLNTSNKINDSQIYVSYTDEEGGWGFICEVEGRFYISEADIDKHSNLIEGQTLVLEYEQISKYSYEHNRENLIKICGYDESDLEDEEDDEWEDEEDEVEI